MYLSYIFRITNKTEIQPETHFEIQKSTLKPRKPYWNLEIKSESGIHVKSSGVIVEVESVYKDLYESYELYWQTNLPITEKEIKLAPNEFRHIEAWLQWF